MTYEETIEYLYTQHPMFSVTGPGAYKPGLDTARMLDDAFGNLHRRFSTIHVGGTNGKGSTSHILAAILAAAGHKVGLYTSPHLADFRERIRVDGHMMSRMAVVEFVERYRRLNLPCNPSFFELTTIMAFDYFASQNVDIAVIEVGLGGRLDTTNIIFPILSVITNVTLDHTNLLGDTTAQIAAEKAGIIKKGVPAVIGYADADTRPVFTAKAAEVGAPITFAQDSPISHTRAGDHFEYGIIPGEKPWIASDLTGEYQPENVNTVMAAVRSGILPGVTPQHVADALPHVCERTGLMGRWMHLGSAPDIICDTGHNIGAWEYLAPRLAGIAGKSHLHIVLGFVNDKDLSHILPLLPRKATTYYFVTPSVERGRDSAQLRDLAALSGVEGNAYPSVAAGFEDARAQAAPSHTIFVGGSTFVVADLLNFLQS